METSNAALLLARLEREYHQMLAEMRQAGHDVSISEMSSMMQDLKWAFLEKHIRKNERGA